MLKALITKSCASLRIVSELTSKGSRCLLVAQVLQTVKDLVVFIWATSWRFYLFIRLKIGTKRLATAKITLGAQIKWKCGIFRVQIGHEQDIFLLHSDRWLVLLIKLRCQHLLSGQWPTSLHILSDLGPRLAHLLLLVRHAHQWSLIQIKHAVKG